MNKYFTGVGRRKSAVARVRISAGRGKLILNGKEISDEAVKKRYFLPMEMAGILGDYDVSTKISGGGRSSWIDAAVLGLCRALVRAMPGLERTLKKENLLSRDSREKERKKPGLRRARRAPQWQKR